MGAKLDLLIQECEEYFTKRIAAYEPKYKKFIVDYNKAITNTEPYSLDETDISTKNKVEVTETTLKQLRKEGWYSAPADLVLAKYEQDNSGIFNAKGGKTILYDSGISCKSRSFTGLTAEQNAKSHLQDLLLKSNINFSNTAEIPGVIFYKDNGKRNEQEFSKEKNGFVPIIADWVEAKWVFIKDPNPDKPKEKNKKDKVEVTNSKVWPRDFFPDKPVIKTYGDFYKWLFNVEYGSVYYKLVDVQEKREEYKDKYDPVTGEIFKDRKFTPTDKDAVQSYETYNPGYPYTLPDSLKDKLNLSATQSQIFKDLEENLGSLKWNKTFNYAKNEIKADVFSKKVLETILSKVDNNYILTKWNSKTPNEHWFEGFQNKILSNQNDVGIIHITSRSFPFYQDYYGGESFIFMDNPWFGKTTLYDALIEAINDKKTADSLLPPPVVTPPPVKVETIKPEDVSGKLILKVKSGPGVIIGQTEKEIIVDNLSQGIVVSSIFEDIQFDKPGDYVIAVTSTSPDVEPTEFKITVTPEPTYIAQEGGKEETPLDGTRPIIAQIDIPTIKLPAMEFERPNSDQDAITVADSIGRMPFVNYMGSPINDRDIYSLKLYHNGILPKCSLTFMDSQGLIKNIGSPQDNSNFEVFIDSKSKVLKSIHLKFKIESFKDMTGGLYGIIGTIDVPQLYRTKYGAMNGTSFEVLRNLCKEAGLGFNSNIINTSDNMTWTFDGRKIHESMTKIMEHSYLSENAFITGYIDYYYCFNYVDIEKESIRDIRSDVGLETGVDKKDDVDKITRLRFINEEANNKSCFYFSQDIRYSNNSSKLNIKKGIRTVFKAYDRSSKTLQIFDIDSLTSDGSKSIILKGSKYDTDDFNNSFTTKYMGKMDLDNVHKNYLYAPILNDRNLSELKKLQMKIKLPTHNLNVYKLQKVNVIVSNTVTSVSNIEPINWRQSGDWIISDIIFSFDTENSKKLFTQEIFLMRKELGKTPDEIEKEEVVNEEKQENDKVNENPIVELPNSVYEIGDIYRVKDTKGNEYLIVVKSLSDDGNSVYGQLTSIMPNNVPDPLPPVISTPNKGPKETNDVISSPPVETPVETPAETPAVEETPKEESEKLTLTQGVLHINKNKTAPLIIVFGGIDVNGKKSGVYMYNYFTSDIISKFNVFIAYSSKIDGAKAYTEIKAKLKEKKINPTKKILYLFSGGYSPGMQITTMGNDFHRIFLVDIWIGTGKGPDGTKKVSDFFKELVDKYAEKVQYYSYGGKNATGGSANKDTRTYIISRAKISHLSSKDHMSTNKPAVKYILEKLI